MKLSAHASSKTLHGRLRSDKGWYLVTGGMRLDSVTEVTLNELVRAPALGHGRFVRLENGAYVEIEARIRRVIAALKRGQFRAALGRRATLAEERAVRARAS